MKIIHYTEADSTKFNNEIAQGVTGRVVIGKDDGAPNFCMRLFTLAPGGFTPRHSHDWEHEILIHEGSGKVFKDGEWVAIQRGSVIFIPGGDEHQFKNDSNADLVFACLIPSGVAEL
jgi:quercetin dioxygenase-like cupin family protein